MLKNTVKAIILTSFDSSTLSALFQPINPGGLDHACFLVRINNDSDEGVIVSYDGVNSHDFIAPATTLELPLQTNSGPMNRAAYMSQGTVIYVKEATAAGTGEIYLSGYYQPQGGA